MRYLKKLKKLKKLKNTQFDFFRYSLFTDNITPINNQMIAPYLFEKKLVLEAIGKKQLKIIQKFREK